MNKTIRLTSLTAMLLFSTAALAAETTVNGTVYANWMMNLSQGAGNSNAFTIDRAYLGADSKISDYTNLRITFDIRPERFTTSSTKTTDSAVDTVNIPALTAYSGYPVILKYAYADWKVKPIADLLKIRLGLQPTAYVSYVESAWGRRYIAKMITDENGWISTSDLGLSAIFALGTQGNMGEAGVSILNGTKYSDVVDKNKNKDFNVYTKLTPFSRNPKFGQTAIFAQFYTGTQNVTITAPAKTSDWKRQIVSLGGKLAYEKWADVAVDLDFQTLGQGPGQTDLKQSGLSFWGELYLNGIVPAESFLRTLALFGRADVYDPNTSVSKNGSTLVIGGIECAPVKGVKAAIGYKQTSYQAPGTSALKFVFVDTEFKF